MISLSQIVEIFFGNTESPRRAAQGSVRRSLKGRSCRIEELESREMLSVAPWMPTDEFTLPIEPETAATVVESVPTLNPLGAITDTNWGTIMTQRVEEGSFTMPSTVNSDSRRGSFTFDLYAPGDATSSIRLQISASGSNTWVNNDSYLRLDGGTPIYYQSVPIVISLNGKDAGTHTVEWLVSGDHAFLSPAGEINYTITIQPPLVNAHDLLIVQNAKANNGLKDSQVSWASDDGEMRITAINAADGRLTGNLDLSGCTLLTSIDVSGNELTALDVTNCTALTYLHCSDNKLSALNVTQNTALTVLICNVNQLMALDVSNNTKLERLDCSNNKLSSLDVSGFESLQILYCNRNELTTLNMSGCTALKLLYCTDNELSTLDVSDFTSLQYLYCDDNELTSLYVSGCTALETLFCHDNKLMALNLSGCAALEYLLCQNNKLTTLLLSGCESLHSLSCYDNELTSLNVSGFTALQDLRCEDNLLNFLNVNGCTILEYLSCYNNELTSLDVSNFTDLAELRCANNLLTVLNVNGCTALEYLICNNNELTSLDVSNFTALTEMWCFENNLTSLNAAGCVNLHYLFSYNNKLASLNVAGCVNLMQLSCQNNGLTSLDVSSCAALYSLNISANTSLTSLSITGASATTWGKLISLNVSGCTGLKTLSCYYNPLTSLNITGCTALESLNCSYTLLTALNASNLLALKTIYCNNCELTSLDVSGCMALESLTISYNNKLTALSITGESTTEWGALKALNVSGCTALKTLSCYYNPLTTLSITGCTALETLNCSYTQLTALNASNLPALKTIHCNNSELTSLNAAGSNALSTLSCQVNRLSFSQLPQMDIASFSYGAQKVLPAPTLEAALVIDLSDEYLEGTTTFNWYYAGGSTPVSNALYAEQAGRFTFFGLNEGVAIYCKMTSTVFTDSTLTTELVRFGSTDAYYSANDMQKIMNLGLTSEEKMNPAVAKWELIGGVYRLTELRVTGRNLIDLDLTGCSALKVLDAHDNPLTTLDIGDSVNMQTLLLPNTTLKVLTITGNGLTALTLSDLTALEELRLNDATLAKFDISANSALKRLSLENVKLGSWDISKSSLTSLCLNDCRLIMLNVAGNTTLKTVSFLDTQLVKMDAAACTALENLSFVRSILVALTTADCAALTNLTFSESLVSELDCSNNGLANLNLSDCVELQALNCSQNHLSFATVKLPPDWSDLVTFGTQKSVVPITLGSGNIADLSPHYLGGKTTFVWKNAANGATVTPKSSVGGVFNFSNLSNGTVIYCEMTNTAFSGSPLKTSEVTIGVTVLTLAAPVISIVSSDTAGDSITLTWQPVTGAAGYEVEWRKESEQWQNWKNNPVTGNTVIINGLEVATTYSFRVRAFNNDPDSGYSTPSGYSNQVSAKTKSKVVPRPTDVEVTVMSATQLKIEWESDSNASGYLIEVYTNRAFSGEPVATKTVVGGDVSETIIDGLEPGMLYFVRVQAQYDDTTTSDASASTDKTRATPFVSLSGTVIEAVVVDDTADATNSVVLDFGSDPNTLDALQYYVLQYSNDGGTTWTTWIIPPDTDGKISVSGLEEDLSYTFQLKGIDGSTISVKTVDSGGQEKPTTTAGEQAALTAPKKPRVKVDKKLTSLESITLDFGKIKASDLANMDTFEITFAAIPKGVKWTNVTGKITVIVSKEALTSGRYYTFTGLRSDTNYQFDVTARDANGNPAVKKGKITSMVSVKCATAKFVAIKGKVVRNTSTISSISVNLTLPANYAVPGTTGWTPKSKPIYGFGKDPSVGFTIDVLGANKGTNYNPGGLKAKTLKNWSAIEEGWSWKIVNTSDFSAKGVVTVTIEISGLPKAGTKYTVVVNAYQGMTNESVAGKFSIATAKYAAVRKVKLERNGTAGKTADDVTQIYVNWTPPTKIPPGASYDNAGDYQFYLVYTTGKGASKVIHEVLVNADITTAMTATIDVAELRTLLADNGLDVTKKQSFVLRVSTNGIESADAKFTITPSKMARLKVKSL